MHVYLYIPFGIWTQKPELNINGSLLIFPRDSDGAGGLPVWCWCQTSCCSGHSCTHSVLGSVEHREVFVLQVGEGIPLTACNLSTELALKLTLSWIPRYMHHVLVYVSHKLLPSIALSSTSASLASQNFDLQYSQNIAIVLTEFHTVRNLQCPKREKAP